MILLSFLAGYFEYVFLTIFIILVHELGHATAASLLKLKVKEIDIFMFGGVTVLDEDLNSSIIKEIIMLVMGPLTQLLLFFSIYKFNLAGYVSDVTYNKFYDINIVLLSFNLLPILPLDGGKLVNNILDLFFSYNTSHIISIVISYITLPLIFMIDNKIFIILIFVFLNIKLLEEIKNHKSRLNKLILERKIKGYTFKKTKYVKNINQIKRNENYFIEIKQ